MPTSRVRPPLYTRLPLAVAIAAVLDCIGYLLFRCQHDASGNFVYPLDDSYIHLAIAKNLALHGVWGVTRHAFGPASSSPLWTALLAMGFKIGGVREMLPLALGAVLAVAVLIAVDFIARREGLPVWANGGLLLLVGLGAPLPMLAASGMEHVCQIFLDVLFLYVVATMERAHRRGDETQSEPGRFGPDFGERRRTVGPEVRDVPVARPGRHAPALKFHDTPKPARFAAMLILAALVCAVRYEGLFLVAAAALVLLLRHRWSLAAWVVAAGFVPVALFAVFSIRHGGMWLPNSVLIKGYRPHFQDLAGIFGALGREAVHKLVFVPPLFSLMLAALAILLFWKPVKKEDALAGDVGRTMLLITVITALAHLQFARAGTFYRYEAYLIVLLLVSLAVAFAHDRFELRFSANVGDLTRLGIALVALVIVMEPVTERARESLIVTPRATRNIFQQQIQFAHFLHRYYDADSVELNDIGAAGFYTDIHLLDFVGLDGTEIAPRVLRHEWGTDAIADMTRKKQVRIAVIYDSWLVNFGGVPKNWIKVGTWQIQDNYICGADTVMFYAMEPAEAEKLRAHLMEFKSELSPYVIASLY